MFKRSENVDTIVPNHLSRYNRKQLSRLSLHERLGSPACVVSRASAILAPLQCRRCSTGVFIRTGMTENSYWASRFARGSVVQLASAMAMFSLHSNDRDWCERFTLCGCGQPSRPPSTRHYAPRDIECISMTTVCFAHGPTVLTNQIS